MWKRVRMGQLRAGVGLPKSGASAAAEVKGMHDSVSDGKTRHSWRSCTPAMASAAGLDRRVATHCGPSRKVHERLICRGEPPADKIKGRAIPDQSGLSPVHRTSATSQPWTSHVLVRLGF